MTARSWSELSSAAKTGRQDWFQEESMLYFSLALVQCAQGQRKSRTIWRFPECLLSFFFFPPIKLISLLQLMARNFWYLWVQIRVFIPVIEMKIFFIFTGKICFLHLLQMCSCEFLFTTVSDCTFSTIINLHPDVLLPPLCVLCKDGKKMLQTMSSTAEPHTASKSSSSDTKTIENLASKSFFNQMKW